MVFFQEKSEYVEKEEEEGGEKNVGNFLSAYCTDEAWKIHFELKLV